MSSSDSTFGRLQVAPRSLVLDALQLKRLITHMTPRSASNMVVNFPRYLCW